MIEIKILSVEHKDDSNVPVSNKRILQLRLSQFKRTERFSRSIIMPWADLGILLFGGGVYFSRNRNNTTRFVSDKRRDCRVKILADPT